ncbi:hypothetical protein D3C74_487930 [compost metagenome]
MADLLVPSGPLGKRAAPIFVSPEAYEAFIQAPSVTMATEPEVTCPITPSAELNWP